MTEPHDVPDDEEVAREPELVDDGEFVFDLCCGAFAFFWLVVGVPFDGACPMRRLITRADKKAEVEVSNTSVVGADVDIAQEAPKSPAA